MKDKESSLDIYALISVYGQHIRDAFFKKIYDLGERKFLFQINSPTIKKIPLYIDVRKGVCLMDSEREGEAGQFAMYLRKIFTDRKIRDIYQVNFDRVIRIDTYGGDSLVLELFRDGNLIVLKDDIIQYAIEPREWKNRKIIRGEKYIPPSLSNPLEMNQQDIESIFHSSKASLVQTMATRLGFGGELAEEILFRSGTDKSILSNDAVNKIPEIRVQLNQILESSSSGKAYVYSDGSVWPAELKYQSDNLLEEKEVFNDEIARKMLEEKKENPANTKIRKIVENQERIMEEYRKNADECKNIGDTISANFYIIKPLLSTLARKDVDIGTLNSNGNLIEVVEKNRAEKYADVLLHEQRVRLYYERTPGENLNLYYEKSKDYRERLDGAKTAMENSLKGIVEEEKKKKKTRARQWFEAYHWFYTSTGKLVLSGKNTDTNEKVVKKHMSDKDVYVHADMYGAPSTVIKCEPGEEIIDDDIREAATFAICFSRAWQNGLASGSAYWVTPGQVSKTPESGQYVRKGSWIIRGKRNYLFSLPMKLSIKMIDNGKVNIPMIYPFREGENALTIIPGGRTKDKIAAEIAKILDIDPEEIISILPTGNSNIVS